MYPTPIQLDLDFSQECAIDSDAGASSPVVIEFFPHFHAKQRAERADALSRVLEHAKSLSW
jgi:hypothetical protein